MSLQHAQKSSAPLAAVSPRRRCADGDDEDGQRIAAAPGPLTLELRLAQGEITESAAMEKIHEARSKLAIVEAILAQVGETRIEHPLAKRCDNITFDHEANPPALRETLAAAMNDFDALLEADFRITPDFYPQMNADPNRNTR